MDAVSFYPSKKHPLRQTFIIEPIHLKMSGGVLHAVQLKREQRSRLCRKHTLMKKTGGGAFPGLLPFRQLAKGNLGHLKIVGFPLVQPENSLETAYKVSPRQ